MIILLGRLINCWDIHKTFLILWMRKFFIIRNMAPYIICDWKSPESVLLHIFHCFNGRVHDYRFFNLILDWLLNIWRKIIQVMIYRLLLNIYNEMLEINYLMNYFNLSIDVRWLEMNLLLLTLIHLSFLDRFELLWDRKGLILSLEIHIIDDARLILLVCIESWNWRLLFSNLDENICQEWFLIVRKSSICFVSWVIV
jgi:hypothetical protein